jgi:hypothetical protein
VEANGAGLTASSDLLGNDVGDTIFSQVLLKIGKVVLGWFECDYAAGVTCKHDSRKPDIGPNVERNTIVRDDRRYYSAKPIQFSGVCRQVLNVRIIVTPIKKRLLTVDYNFSFHIALSDCLMVIPWL